MLLLPAFTGSPQPNKVYNCDAMTLLKAMADKSVDTIITSPPYNIERKKGSGLFANRKQRFFIDEAYSDYDDSMPEIDYQTWLHSIVAECMRVSRGLVWVNHKTRYRDGVAIHPLQFLTFPMWTEVVWNRNSSTMLNARKFAVSHEYIFGFGKPHYWNNNVNTMMTVWNVTRGSSNHDENHPCPYPETLVERLIEASCPDGGLVLDPFLGSGTTAKVARQMGRDYIGCDISLDYCGAARGSIAKPFTPSFMPQLELAG
jgi:site-specific DNA-methyltransferase (adenine-specific)